MFNTELINIFTLPPRTPEPSTFWSKFRSSY